MKSLRVELFLDPPDIFGNKPKSFPFRSSPRNGDSEHQFRQKPNDVFFCTLVSDDVQRQFCRANHHTFLAYSVIQRWDVEKVFQEVQLHGSNLSTV